MTFLAMTLGSGQVMLLGEVVSKASVSYESILRDAVRAAGYDHEDLGMDWRTVNVPGPQLGTLGAPLGAPGSRFVRWRRYRGIAMCPKKQQKNSIVAWYLRVAMWLCYCSWAELSDNNHVYRSKRI